MNSKQRIEYVLQGQKPDRVPVMLHNFLMAANESQISMAQYRTSPEAIAKVHLDAVEKYGYDGIVIDVDTCTLAGADPTGVLTMGTSLDVKNKVNELLNLYSASPRFILNAGCAIPPSTLSVNLLQLIKCAKEFEFKSN